MDHNKCYNCVVWRRNFLYKFVHIFCITISYCKIIVEGGTMFDSLSEESYLMCIIKPFCSQTQFKKDVLLLHNKALKFVHNTFPDTMCNCASFHNQTQFQKIIFCCTMKLQIFIHNTFPLQTSSPLAHSCCNLFLSFEQNFQITKLFFGSGTFFGRTNFP